MKEPKPVQLYCVRDSAKLLGISEKTMWKLINERKISIVRISRRVLISESALLEFQESCTVKRIDASAAAQAILGTLGCLGTRERGQQS